MGFGIYLDFEIWILDLRTKFVGAVRVLTGGCGCASCEPRMSSHLVKNGGEILNAEAKTPAQSWGTLEALLTNCFGVKSPAELATARV